MAEYETDETQDEIPQTLEFDPNEIEIKPIVRAGRHDDCSLESLSYRKNRRGKKVCSQRYLVRDAEVGTISIFHDEPIEAKSGSRWPRWAEALGVNRDELRTLTIQEIAEQIGVPGRKVVLEVGIRPGGSFENEKGEIVEYPAKNTIKDVFSA